MGVRDSGFDGCPGVRFDGCSRIRNLMGVPEFVLGKRIVAAKPSATDAARYAVVNAGGGVRNEL